MIAALWVVGVIVGLFWLLGIWAASDEGVGPAVTVFLAPFACSAVLGALCGALWLAVAGAAAAVHWGWRLVS